jgi:hypothetical protein
VAVAALGGYRASYLIGAICALASGVLLLWPRPSQPNPPQRRPPPNPMPR